MEAVKEKYFQMLSFIRQYTSIIVAFSGGLDSGFLLYAVREAGTTPDHRRDTPDLEVWGPRRELCVLAVTALSPAVPRWDTTDAQRIASLLGIPHRFIQTDLLKQAEYVKNTPQRCYFCKSDLYERLEKMRQKEGYEVIFNGTQADDLRDTRPGLKAAEEHRVVSPLLTAGLTKAEIRLLARDAGLFFWDKPSSPCLASRIPHGLPVTETALLRVHRAESALRQAGFKVVRVRDRGNSATLELGSEDFTKVDSRTMLAHIQRTLSSTGYTQWNIQKYRSEE